MKKRPILLLTLFFLTIGVITSDAAVQTSKADTPKSIWLPAKTSPERAATDAGATPGYNFLKNLKGGARRFVFRYKGSIINSSRTFINGNLKTSEGQWSCEVKS